MDIRLVDYIARHAWAEVIGTPWADASEAERAAWVEMIAAALDVVAVLRTKTMRWDGAQFVEVTE